MQLATTLVAVLIITGAQAQSLMSSEPGRPLWFLASDAAVLELQEPRNDMACTLTPLKPLLGFNYMFHTGYEVSVPRKQFYGSGNMLTILFRVIPENRKEDPVYFTQTISVPLLRDQRGQATLGGAFLAGRGKYHVDWLMRDRQERFCAHFWDFEAKVSAKDGRLIQAIEPDVVQPIESDLFAGEPSVVRQPGNRPLHVRVLLNLAPQDSVATVLSSADLEGPVGILRKINREVRIARYSLVACSLERRQVIHQQAPDHEIDLPGLGKAVESISFASVSVEQLARKNGYGDFLAKLITDPLEQDRPDAVILVSPSCGLELALSPEAVRLAEGLPVFYLNYDLDGYRFRVGDALGRVVKQLRGFAYTIAAPRDFVNVWPEIVARIGRIKVS